MPAMEPAPTVESVAAKMAPPRRERRGAERPWSKRLATAPAVAPAPARRAASDAAGDGDWSEF
jgi:hypothetical protein